MGFEALSRIQKGMAAELEAVLSSSMLPQSVLISGEKGSGRLTAALDLAFTLTGEEEARPYLRSGSVAYIPSRDMMTVFRASISLFRRQRSSSSRLFLIETVRRALLQYHSSIAPLYDGRKIAVKGGSDGSGGKGSVSFFANAEAVDSIILPLEDADDITEEEAEAASAALCRRMIPDFFSIGKKAPGASIDEIRALQDWLEEGTAEKAVIFENPEDCSEGALSSMLKMLEEPPMHSHLILISSHPMRLMETILSRVRHFRMPALGEEAVSAAIGERFSIYGRWPSFEAFFFEEGCSREEKALIDDDASLYADALLRGRTLPADDIGRIFSDIERISGYGYFRTLVEARIASAVSGGMDTGRGKRSWRAYSSMMTLADVYNMSIRTALDLALREAADGK